MASTKNSARSKRKYGDAQKSRTARNKGNKAKRHERLMARFAARRESLVGRDVHSGDIVGMVLEVNGTTLTIEDRATGRVVDRLRKRVKPL